MTNIQHEALFDIIRTTAKLNKNVLITTNSRFQEDLGVDSLDLVSVLLNIQDEYGVEWTDEEISSINTVADIFEGLNRRGIKHSAA